MRERGRKNKATNGREQKDRDEKRKQGEGERKERKWRRES